MAFASAMASSRSRTAKIGASGPKHSCVARYADRGTLVEDGRLHQRAATLTRPAGLARPSAFASCAWRLPALRAAGSSITVPTRVSSDSGSPHEYVAREAHETRRELARSHVCTSMPPHGRAALAAVAKASFAGEFGGEIQVGVRQHDQRRMPAEFEAESSCNRRSPQSPCPLRHCR